MMGGGAMFSQEGPTGLEGADDYQAGDLWLEITGVTNGYAFLTLLGTEPSFYYQLLSNTNLNNPVWTLGPIIRNDTGTNRMFFIAVATNQQVFFRAARSGTLVSISPGANGAEPNPPDNNNWRRGQFTIERASPAELSQLTVFYRISGTASNGMDYESLSGSVVISEDENLQ